MSTPDLTIELTLLEAMLGPNEVPTPQWVPHIVYFRRRPGLFVAHRELLLQRSPCELFSAEFMPPPLSVPMQMRSGRGWALNDNGEWRWPPTEFAGLIEIISAPAWRKRRGLPPLLTP